MSHKLFWSVDIVTKYMRNVTTKMADGRHALDNLHVPRAMGCCVINLYPMFTSKGSSPFELQLQSALYLSRNLNNSS